MSPGSRILGPESLVCGLVAQRLRVPYVDPDVPLARFGVDSLASIELAAEMEGVLGLHVPLDAVTEYSTVRSLCAAILAGTNSQSAFDVMRGDAILPSVIQPCRGRIVRRAFTSLAAARHILLTGATGFLGIELLDRLVARTDARITCLARSALAHESTRVEIVQGDLTQPRAGLTERDWRRLAASVDCICHAGASVSWIGSYETLRGANVLATRELLRFACDASASFHFISSISVCYSTHRNAADESLDALAAVEGLHFGYAQTKAVAESLVQEAGARGLHVRIYRPALITGDSRTGRFNPGDMLTRLIAGCVRMGAAPDLDWQLDACPVDTVAELIIGLSGAPETTVHLVHPRPRHWRECVLWMRLYGYDITLVPYREWTSLLRETPADHPLHPLQSFFLDERERGLTVPELHEETRTPRVDATQSAKMIAALGVSIPPLDAGLLETYFAAFIRDGKLPPPKTGLPRVVNAVPSLPLSGGRDMAEQLLLESAHDISDLTVTPLAAADSIISELTAWRSGGVTGLFDVRAGGRRYVLKVKPHADVSHGVGLALAGLCGEELRDGFALHGRGLGLDAGHERELAVYRDADDVARLYMPEAVATRADERTRTWAVLLEYIDQDMLLDSVNRPDSWTREHIEVTIDGMAALHAAWHGRIGEIRRQQWCGQLRSTRTMHLMAPLWRALADHASPMFSAWTDDSVSAVQHDLIDRIPDWRPALECLPQTLVHNDFNPRNVCLRNRAGRLRLCAYDWELATIGAPVRDLAEFLCFVLPADVDRQLVDALIDRHLVAFETRAAVKVDRHAWREGFHAALCELLIDRLSVYAMVNRVKQQAFLPRVVRTWRRLWRSGLRT